MSPGVVVASSAGVQAGGLASLVAVPLARAGSPAVSGRTALLDHTLASCKTSCTFSIVSLA